MSESETKDKPIRGMQIEVKIADTELFKQFVQVCCDFANDEAIPAEKRQEFVERLLTIGVLQE